MNKKQKRTDIDKLPTSAFLIDEREKEDLKPPKVGIIIPKSRTCINTKTNYIVKPDGIYKEVAANNFGDFDKVCRLEMVMSRSREAFVEAFKKYIQKYIQEEQHD